MIRLFFLSLLLLVPVAPVLADGPRIEVTQPDFQFGSVFQGEKVEHVFEFRNAGDDPLLIDRVKSSCGCTAALVSSKELAPGATGEVHATFDSTRFHGNVVKTIYVYTNDPNHKLVQLHLRGNVKEELQLSARSVTLGPVAAGQSVSTRVKLTNKGDQVAAIGPARTTAREIQVDFPRRLLQPGETADIELTATAGSGKTVVSGYLLIPTDSPRLPELRIPLQLRITKSE
ncbi:hypothetical protein C2E25_12740 [Geothermobacter hydrogeniphilus]|uniref:DUF1573 domain-containing protein n=1 Tax=Geothermobacter hydrogeniphilus TaxID=1969733 RepID=A0A2K2H7W9_9BACT|nr:DUF1573 domain-containing protein [Geothermobacter hydrogeniphilus]PNU19351.1 hypothetical protein C2E25_12740 [Geothermobacter hydrogeniphilus]